MILSPFDIGVIYDCLHKAKRMADVEFVEIQDAEDLQSLKIMAEDLVAALDSISIRETEEEI